MSLSKYSYLALRLGLAAVFFWLGIDSFFHPFSSPLLYLVGVFEILIGLSLVTKVFIKVFSLSGILILIGLLIIGGITNITVADIGLIGSLISVFLWSERKT